MNLDVLLENIRTPQSYEPLRQARWAREITLEIKYVHSEYGAGAKIYLLS